MHHRRAPLQPGSRFQTRPGEHREAAIVVGVIVRGASVDPSAVEAFRTIDQPDPDAIVVDSLDDTRAGATRPTVHRKADHFVAVVGSPVPWNDDGDFAPQPGERRRQRAAHVAEAAGLRVGYGLRYHHQHARQRLLHDNQSSIGKYKKTPLGPKSQGRRCDAGRLRGSCDRP